MEQNSEPITLSSYNIFSLPGSNRAIILFSASSTEHDKGSHKVLGLGRKNQQIECLFVTLHRMHIVDKKTY